MNIKGERHLLAKGKANRANAYREYLRIADRHNPEVATAGSAAAICQLFMTYARANLKPNTVNGHTVRRCFLRKRPRLGRKLRTAQARLGLPEFPSKLEQHFALQRD